MVNRRGNRANRRRNLGSGGSGKGSQASSAKPLLLVLTAFAVAAIGVLAFLAATTGTGGSTGSSAFTPNDEGLIQPGAEAPRATAESVGGGDVSLPTASSDGPTLLVFFATWCPHCQDEAPVIADLAEENENLNVVMAGIDGEDNPEKIQAFAEEYGIEGEALYEPSLGSTYQVTGYPTNYVINDSGTVTGANAGETPENVLQSWIDEA